MTDPSTEKQSDLQRIMESARRLGVELEEEDAQQWLQSMNATKNGDTLAISTRNGAFGHKITALDLSDKELEYFKRIGQIVEFEDIPGQVETALALSGGSAQLKIRSAPGDCDYFERVNILAVTREEACKILSRIMLEKILATLQGPNYQLVEVKYGSFPEDIVVGDKKYKEGSPIIWRPDQIKAGKMEGFSPDGSAVTLTWDEVSTDPGWCKLDWVVADPIRKQLANASNMLDVTWEAPDGNITPLDGYLDPYFQEVYLDAASVPIFAKLAQHASGNALDDYVNNLEREIEKHLTEDINYGKVAKRMYNIFRLTGRYEEASFLRELFDEPTTMLYEVWALIRTIDDAGAPGSSITREQLVQATDDLIIEVVKALEGEEETEIVSHLLKLRDALANPAGTQLFTDEAEAARSTIINLVNDFFYERLTALPTIKDYMDDFQNN